jgi:hypothetical protein
MTFGRGRALHSKNNQTPEILKDKGKHTNLNYGAACSVIGQVFARQARFSFHASPAELIHWNASTKSRSSERHPQ